MERKNLSDNIIFIVLLAISFILLLALFHHSCRMPAQAQMHHTMGRCEDFVWPVNVEIIEDEDGKNECDTSPSGPVTATMGIEGLMLVSLPVDPSGSDKLWALFPGMREVYGFNSSNGNYVRISCGKKLHTGKGYWMHAGKSRIFVLKGDEITEQLLVLKKGWHLIGGCTYPARISSHNGVIMVIYAFIEGGYVRIAEDDCIYPGQGYWLLYEPYDRKGIVEMRIEP